MTLDMRREEIFDLVDAPRGLVNRKIFSDEEIYKAELEQIFARAWNFMCHESQIPNPGDFFMNYIGEDRVIVVRDKTGQPQVLLNTCRHRGNAVCRADEGHATSFMCTYHGWTYDLQGKLVGVPGFKDYYHEDLNRAEWGLIAGRAESYKGFVFATLDPDAPSLDEYLGPVGRMGLDVVVGAGDTKVIGGIQKWIIDCNWKFAVDNVWDFYHAEITHTSALMGGWRFGEVVKDAKPMPIDAGSFGSYMSVLGDYGHTIGGPAADLTNPMFQEGGLLDISWRTKPEGQRMLGGVGQRAIGHPNIFPNLWVFPAFSKISLRLPKGPTQTEIWWFAFYNPDHSEEQRNYGVKRQLRHDGPSGMFEQEDGENWGQSTRGTRSVVARRYPLNYSLNVGRGVVIDDETGPPHIEAGVNEHSQVWFYKNWTDWLASESWSDLKANHSQPPERM